MSLGSRGWWKSLVCRSRPGIGRADLWIRPTAPSRVCSGAPEPDSPVAPGAPCSRTGTGADEFGYGDRPHARPVLAVETSQPLSNSRLSERETCLSLRFLNFRSHRNIALFRIFEESLEFFEKYQASQLSNLQS